MSRARYDVAIVGAGIVGVAVAREAVREGLSVGLVDEGPVGGGTTSAGMGHVVAVGTSAAELTLARYSRELWATLGPSLPSEAGFRPIGTVWVGRTAEDRALLDRTRASLSAAGVASRPLSAEEVTREEPGLAAGGVGGLLVPGDFAVHAPAVARHLVASLSEGGRLQLLPSRAEALDDRGVRLASGGRVEARYVVNATGVRLSALSPEVPVVPRKGQLALLGRGAALARHQVAEVGYLSSVRSSDPLSMAFNVQPQTDGSLLVGASRQNGTSDPSVEPAVIDALVRRAREFLPGAAGLPVVGARAGLRPASPDHLPWIGPDRSGVWVAGGLEGLGITASLGAGRLLVDQMLGRASSIPIAPYLPGRSRAPVAGG